jgi:hypothetical protein
MSVQSISGVVETAIQTASNATGVDFGYLMGAARRESGFNPNAKASTSSATGLFQFVEQTWLDTLKKHGGKYGLGGYADLIQKGSDGRLHVAGGQARAEVMNLRLNPQAAALMAGELAADHAAYLRGRVGREPTAGELYAAHVLGPKGSATLIDAVRQSPGAKAAPLFPEAAEANRAIFFKGGRPASVSEVYANLTRGAGDGGAVQAAPAQPDPGYIQFADAGRADQIREEQDLINLILRGPGQSDDTGLGMGPANSLFSTEMLRALSEAGKKTTA